MRGLLETRASACDRNPEHGVFRPDVAHKSLPGSRLEVFEDAGHFPQLYDPLRSAWIMRDFIETTEPTKLEFTDEVFDR